MSPVYSSGVGQRRKRAIINATGCGFEEMKYLIFPFFNNEANRCVESRHSTRHASKVRQKAENGDNPYLYH